MIVCHERDIAPCSELWHGERDMPPRSRATTAPAKPAIAEQSQLAESVDRLTREIQAMRGELDEARAEIAWAMRNAIAERPGELLDTTATTWPEQEHARHRHRFVSHSGPLSP